MDDQNQPKRISGQVSWNRPDGDIEQDNQSQTAANEAVARGPLTGKPLVSDESAAQSAKPSRRQRKSDTAFRTISEVADELDVQQHVLRFWETKFSQVRPLKRGGGRRYYRPEDVTLLKRIHHLLYTEGYTIKGVQKLLKEQGKKAVLEAAAPEVEVANTQEDKNAEGLSSSQRNLLQSTLSELKALRDLVKSE